ncbi:hypothetical protein GN958_ATG02258 [Phytophthora infestans]|uniref:Uncharacterized protein n=1 Tax=Phytophthora infestans TaxID=4787 RepID=A0A8S9VBG8_PHYIN|nr:hypothetical protein GN958_ATG02258 [Phytophthora infestans]
MFKKTSNEFDARTRMATNCINSNPFDAHDRDPFPSFMTALADAQSPEEFGCTGSALDWSIDTLAELKPVIFSPLPQQKFGASTLGTPHGTIGFFEDEKQYEVLRTPLQPTPLIKLNRRCNETMPRCEGTPRKRRGNMINLPHPMAKHRRLPNQSSTTPSRSTPPRPSKWNQLGTTENSICEWKSPAMRPPQWSASPIGILDNRQQRCAAPSTLHFDARTPFVRSPRSTTPKQSSKLRLSFGLSPITFLSPQAEEKIEEEKSSEDKPSNGNTLFLDSLFANESEKEISEQQAKMEDGGQQDECTSSSHGNSTSARMRFSLMEPVRSSMPRRRRQQAFMEAMEAEARSSETCGKVSPMR